MAAKINLSYKTINSMIEMFIAGHSIPELMQHFNLGRNKITSTLRKNMNPDEYSMAAKRIIAMSGRKSAIKLKGRKNPPHSAEWTAKIAEANRGKKRSKQTKDKISKANKKQWENGVRTLEKHAIAMSKAVETNRKNGYYEKHGKKHSEWMKANAPMRGKRHTKKTKDKMKKARKKFFENGGETWITGKTHADDTRKILSQNTKQMWKEGKFSYSEGSVMRSKLEKQIYKNVLTVFPDAQHSRWLTHDDTTYVFDIYVPSIKTFIEVNGDYWHLNPNLYKSSHYDKYRNITAHEIWENDAKKLSVAKSLGFKAVVVWESLAKDFDPKQLLL